MVYAIGAQHPHPALTTSALIAGRTMPLANLLGSLGRGAGNAA